MIGVLVVVLGVASGAGLWWYRQSGQATGADATPQPVPPQPSAPDPTSAPPTPTETAPPQPTPPPTTPPPTTPPPTEPASFPPGAQECHAGVPVGGLTRSASGNSVTTCAFAESVRAAYGGQSQHEGIVNVLARSPVTGQTYVMTCTAGRPVVCRGGNNALVYLL